MQVRSWEEMGRPGAPIGEGMPNEVEGQRIKDVTHKKTILRQINLIWKIGVEKIGDYLVLPPLVELVGARRQISDGLADKLVRLYYTCGRYFEIMEHKRYTTTNLMYML